MTKANRKGKLFDEKEGKPLGVLLSGFLFERDTTASNGMEINSRLGKMCHNRSHRPAMQEHPVRN